VTERGVIVRAPAATVYALISDPLRMADWSPECVHCEWIDGSSSAQVGARFRGTSRNGRRRWSTTSVITTMEPNRTFAWEVTYFGRPVARWEYRVEPVEGAVRLTESVIDRRGRLLRAVSPLITGSPDRDARNGSTMERTLEAVRDEAERSTAE
jgi:uncharacterized protein YndB with AHSA1/START domain